MLDRKVSIVLSFVLSLGLAACEGGGSGDQGADGNADAGIIIPPGCGDGVVSESEVCDGAALAGASCQSLGLGAGALQCRADCAGYDDAQCCSASCTGIECGPDPVCGVSCGTCSQGVCTAAGQCEGEGQCVPATCTSLGISCGSGNDGCGGVLSCGECEQASSWVAVGAGDEHSCALRSDNTIWCWGRNQYSQLGENGAAFGIETSPVQMGSASDWLSLSVGSDHACGVRTSEEAWCWGRNTSGQLGNGTLVTSAAPVHFNYISGSSSADITVSAGHDHSCAVQATGALVCAGSNASGQLGNGTNNSSSAPSYAGAGFVAAEAGTGHTCAIRSNGNIHCGGAGAAGQLGNGQLANKNTMVFADGSGDWSALELGDSFSCGLRAGGSLWCWGFGIWGQIGDGQSASVLEPSQVGPSLSWVQVSAGGRHACAIAADSSLYCWGAAADGQLGTGSTLGANIPQFVGTGWATVSAGLNHSCGTKLDGSLWCWGNGGSGRLGNGGTSNSSTPVEVVLGL